MKKYEKMTCIDTMIDTHKCMDFLRVSDEPTLTRKENLRGRPPSEISHAGGFAMGHPCFFWPSFWSKSRKCCFLVGGLEHQFYFPIYWEQSSQLTNIFQRGSNHQPVSIWALFQDVYPHLEVVPFVDGKNDAKKKGSSHALRSNVLGWWFITYPTQAFFNHGSSKPPR